MSKIVIIGNGIAGITAARWIRKLSDYEIIVISKESKFHFSRPALMYVYMGHMRHQDILPYEEYFWNKNRINLIKEEVIKLDFNSKKVILSDGQDIIYDKLIIASGSKTTLRGWRGENLEGVTGLYSLQDLFEIDRLTPNIKNAVIVGGGLIGVELAEMLISKKINTKIFIREKSYWNNVLPEEESLMITKHIRKHGVAIMTNEELEEIHGLSMVKSITTKSGKTYDCDYVGICTGVEPNILWIDNKELDIARGIIVNSRLETNIQDVYAIGDCAQIDKPHIGRKSIEAVWYTARMMGETVAHNICAKQVMYNPGIWFNSAKFFDIEYQVYGQVPIRYDNKIKSIFWQNVEQEKSIRIVYNSDGVVIGFNLLGIRYRQEVCLKWIEEKVHIENVLPNLSMANFDPELYKKHEKDLIAIYNDKNNRNIKLKRNGMLNNVIQYLRS